MPVSGNTHRRVEWSEQELSMKWQYCVVHIIYTDKSKTPDDGKVSLIYYSEIAEGGERKDENQAKFGPVDGVIAKLGADGWDMVNVVGTEQLTSFYFKRQAGK
jgi:hypothetical protein